MVVHNADLIFLYTGFTYFKSLAVLVSRVAAFAAQYRALPALGFTHFQPGRQTRDVVDPSASLLLLCMTPRFVMGNAPSRSSSVKGTSASGMYFERDSMTSAGSISSMAEQQRKTLGSSARMLPVRIASSFQLHAKMLWSFDVRMISS